MEKINIILEYLKSRKNTSPIDFNKKTNAIHWYYRGDIFTIQFENDIVRVIEHFNIKYAKVSDRAELKDIFILIDEMHKQYNKLIKGY